MAQWSLANLAAWAVQVAVLVAAGVWLPARLRLGSPRSRVVLFRVVLVACIALPLVQPWRPTPAVPVSADMSDIPLVEPAAGNVAIAPHAAAPAGQPAIAQVRGWLASVPWSRAAMTVLAGGVLLRLAWLGLGLVSLARLRRQSTPIDPELPSIREAERAVGTGAAFREAPRVSRPVTFGLKRPVVLVPPGFAGLHRGHQLAIACHELLHVRRQDWLRVLGDEIVRALLWFHPAIWWLVEQIHLSTEQMIDRQAVEMVGDRRSYLRALLALAGADPRPRLQPAACFLDHGHLRQRVTMLMEETSMSRVRLVASLVAVVTVVAVGGWWSVSAFPLRDTVALPTVSAEAAVAASPAPVYSSMPSAAPAKATQPPAELAPQAQAPPPQAPPAQAPRLGMSTAPPIPPMDQASLEKKIKEEQKAVPYYFLLSRMYEDSGDLAKAAATIEAAAAAAPSRIVYMQIVGFYNRQGNFDKVSEWLGQWSAHEPGEPIPHYTASAYYWEKAYRDTSLSDEQKRIYINHGLAEANAALAINPEYSEALTYKNLLLRSKALVESDPNAQKALIAEANTLRAQAISIRNARAAAGLPAETYPSPKVSSAGDSKVFVAAPPPPPPPPPPAGSRGGGGGGVAGGLVGGVGGGIGGGTGGGIGSGIGGGVAGGVIGGVVGGLPGAPPPPPTGPDGKVVPVRVGGTIQPPTKIKDVKPIYPEEAQQAGVQGVVIIEAVIGIDGTVSDAKVLRSIPLLDQAALDAVKQWEFTPTILNGVPVQVIMTVTVGFTLQDK